MVFTITALAGCSATPTPTPTTTPAFASEEEAFAAAEETFTRYAAATNATDLSDPDSFEAVFDWLVADALAAARENYSQFYALEITRSGTSEFDSFTIAQYAPAILTAHLCLDVTKVELINSDGSSAVPEDREPRQAIEVELVPARTATGLAISSTLPTEDIQCT